MRTGSSTRQRLRAAKARSTGARSLAWAELPRFSWPLWLLPFGRRTGARMVPPAPRSAVVSTSASVTAVVIPSVRAAGRSLVEPGSGLTEEERVAVHVGRSLDVDTVVVVFAAVERVVVVLGGQAGAAPRADQCAVQQQAPLFSGSPHGVSQVGCVGGEYVDALVDVNLNGWCRSVVHDEVGAGEAAVDQVCAVLDHLEFALDGPGELVEVGGGEVADVAFDQRPDAFLWVEKPLSFRT